MVDYNSIDALNWSTLKLLETSAAYMKHMCDHPDERVDKPEYIRGRAIHCTILEPDQFAGRYEIMPTFSGKGSVAAKQAWLDELPKGVEPLKHSDYDLAWRCADVVHSNEEAIRYINEAQCEKVITWETQGVKCKGRVDALTDRVIDLKTTRRRTMGEIEKDAAAFDYHAQLAWYHDGAVKAGLIDGSKLPVAIFVSIDPSSTFVDVAILDMDAPDTVLEGVSGTLEYGRAKYRKLLNQYIGCKAANWWPGMATSPALWLLPEWKLRKDENEVH